MATALRIVLTALALIAAGWVLPEWALFIAIISLAKGLVVLGLIVMWRAGLVSFGQGLFYGLGAYTVGILPIHTGLSDAFVLLAAATAIAGLVAYVLGFLLARYREIFFAMLCLAFSMILYGVLVKSEPLGSTDGFHVVPVSYGGISPSAEFSGLALYVFTVVVAVAAGAITWRYLESIMGQLSTAVRDNELRVEYLGFSVRNVVHFKFTLAGALAGAGGAIAAIAVGHVDPEMVWWIASGEFVFVTILSGAGSVIAPFVGSAVFEMLRTLALQYAPNVWQIIVGGTLLAVIMFLPGGLWSLVERARRGQPMSVILETRDLNRSFGAVSAARDINVVVNQGENIGIIGANGAGKTTFVNIVTGYVKPTRGQVLFGDREITHLTPRQVVQAGLTRSFQVPQLFGSATVFENLLVAIGIAESRGLAFWHRLRESDRLARCQHALEEFQIAEYRDQPVSTLPQGVRKLLDIAMAMVHEPKLVLLDEPTSGITSEEKFSLMDIVVGALGGQGLTMLFIEHDMDVISRYAERVMAFYDGQILADGPTSEVLANDEVRERVIGEAPVIGERDDASH